MIQSHVPHHFHSHFPAHCFKPNTIKRFIGLTIQGGLTLNKDWSFFGFFGIMLSTPLFTRSLAQLMTLATNFVFDCWDGHSLIKSLSPLSWKTPYVIIDWTDTSIFLIIPTIVAMSSLYVGSDDWLVSLIIVFDFIIVILFCFRIYLLCFLGGPSQL